MSRVDLHADAVTPRLERRSGQARSPSLPERGASLVSVILLTWGLLSSGCAGLQPLNGVPSNAYAQENAPSRSGKQTIDLSLLRQTPPPAHLLDAGDVLGVYIEGVLGRRDQVPPVHFPLTGDTPPSLGYPIPVREDGTVSLPLIKPIMAKGMTVRELEETVRKRYTEEGQQILNPEANQVLFSLQKPRNYNVLVMRQESSSAAELGTTGRAAGSLNLGAIKRGTGKVVALPAYKNDVLHALAETGGLPGLDAENTIYVLRRRKTVPPGATIPGAQVRPQPTLPTVSQRPVPSRTGDIVLAAAEFPAEAESSFGHTAPKLTLPRVTSTAHASPVALGGHSAPVPTPGMISQSSLEPGPAGPVPNGPAMDPRYSGSYSAPQPGYAPVPQNFVPGGYPQPSSGPWPREMSGQQWGGQFDAFGRDTQIIRIPVRLHPGEVPQFTEQDVILQDGDIVFIESRETEIFYTGGLLGGGQYTLPRDYDLDVLGAVSIASGQVMMAGSTGNRVGGVSSLNQDVSVGASDVVILRQLPEGGQIPIKVDLNKAIRDPQHRVRILPGDYIILRYKPHEAVAAFIERNLLAGGLIAVATSGSAFGGGN